MLAAVAGGVGLVVGSFLNVVIHRVPRRESVVWPGSRCPRCGSSILARDNVPLLSYLLLRGRCRRCRVRIPARYPLVEGITGALFAAAVVEFGIGMRLIPALVLLAALVALAATDLEHRLLPNAVVLPAAAAGLILSAAADPTRWWVYPLSALGVAGGLLALALARPGGMGMGDVKMGGMLGAFLGPYAFLAVFLGALGGALVSGGLMLLGKAGRESRLPFGTFMSFGGAAALFFGPELWGLYLGLLR
ncbi:prepilin peptidase [Rubrobacter xylanophilus]|uniref:prepilin peptidase n=1 Tax=Rubrobacter xylanophilus TaxID=49319 RepID=UPI001FCC82D3|nr:A24 family peptidase [Rubrobacter xylanophilus]